MQIQWFPGHMAKTQRLIKENLKLVDLVLELCDARIPVASRNPEIDKLCAGKPILTLFNKADLADPAVTKMWQDKLSDRAFFISCKEGSGVSALPERIRHILSDKIERDKARGIVNRSVKLMLVGIPNSGKSSLINRISKKASTKVADKPGVTRGKQWIRLSDGYELLDTPGVLWPKFEDEQIARNLAITGAVKDVILDTEELCHYLLAYLRDNYPDELSARYKISGFEGLEGYEITEKIGRARGFVISGGEIDTLRASNIILDEFRSGTIGRISLERP